jgi:hypothetical protein
MGVSRFLLGSKLCLAKGIYSCLATRQLCLFQANVETMRVILRLFIHDLRKSMDTFGYPLLICVPLLRKSWGDCGTLVPVVYADVCESIAPTSNQTENPRCPA